MEYLGKLEDKMKLIADNSVQMIFADFPFGTTKCAWDTPIDIEIFWPEAWRVLKNNGVVICKAQIPFSIKLGMSQLQHLKYEWIWEKTSATGALNSKKMPLKSSESLQVYYKKLPTYNPQKTQGHKRKVSKAVHKVNSIKTEVYGEHGLTDYDSTERYPRNVLKFASDKQRLAIHSTQTPEALTDYFVNTYTNPGDLVLDPCRGSNTMGVSCDRLGREYIGIENAWHFYEIGLLRRANPTMKTKQLKQLFFDTHGLDYDKIKL